MKQGVRHPASYTDGFLWRDTCVSSIKLNRPIWKKMSLLYLVNSDLYEVFLSKTSKFSQGNNVLEIAHSNRDGFL
jgi:hypothetical protein